MSTKKSITKKIVEKVSEDLMYIWELAFHTFILFVLLFGMAIMMRSVLQVYFF